MGWDLSPILVSEMRAVPLTVTQSERLHASLDVAARGAGYPDVQRVASRLARETARTEHEDALAAYAAAALAYVQASELVGDPSGVDVLAGPVATLRAGEGDCLTLSTLYLSLLFARGITATLARITRHCDPIDHVAVLVWVHDGWSWADPGSRLPFGRVSTGTPCPQPDTITMVV